MLVGWCCEWNKLLSDECRRGCAGKWKLTNRRFASSSAYRYVYRVFQGANEQVSREETLLDLSKVYETRCYESVNQLLAMGCILLGMVEIIEEPEDKHFLYSVGCPKDIKELPSWVI